MAHPLRGLVRFAALGLVLLLFLAGPARAQSLSLNNLVVDNQAGSFMARFGVVVEGIEDVALNLDNGVVLGLTCDARLSRRRSLWSNKTVNEVQWVSRLQQDALTGEYVLVLPGRETPYREKDLPRLLTRAWSTIAVDLGPWNKLERGEDYVLDLSIKLNQVDIPGWFRRTLFFWSWDVVPATTYQLEFRY
ncbi:DUF4390 domain-containing protein [Desulfovibrio aminophilus]|nr:DUF4390 domain-containing protein [Desulfovibrio aminophilus]MCM0755729.1 DUF4390 domain-containing protein [Desulfovibrio aminophilus]